MRIWLDTEFMDDGNTIELLSIGMIKSNGETYYAVNGEADESKANEWVKEHVLPYLYGPGKTKAEIRSDILAFAGVNPEFWGYFADYDWVVIAQLFGTMMDLPRGWPMFCMDVQQERMRLGVASLPIQEGQQHNALADAIWTKECWEYLQKIDEGKL